ncbi:hypothetical protein SLA2020_106750 [Shorea laevis]
MASAFCVPVFQNCLGTVAGNWIDRSLKRISYPIILVFKMKANVEKLRKQVDKLEEELDHVERCTQDAERRGEEMALKYKNWRDAACKFLEAANTIEDDEEKAKKKCFFGMCLNPRSRYKLSKKAVEDSMNIAEHVRNAREFSLQPSYSPIPQRVVAAPVKGFQQFESRMDVLDEIMKALQSPNINIIGLHGMPGVGKTMLLEEVKRKAKQYKLFDAVVMASVTKKDPNYRKIQDDIAYDLGLELPVGIGDRSAANMLRARFLKERKVLVILDDIWDKLDLKALGIPFEDQQKMNVEIGSSSTKDQQTKCKILLSSRDLNVLSIEMGTQKEIVINQLEDQEAWQMFKKIVGDRAESSKLKPIGFGIVTECKGLPLAIATLAKALKNKSLPEWRSALQRLKNPSPRNFSGIHAEVYTAIEVSYNHLGSEELKQTFLLASLMGHNASVQDLLKYGVGLGLFSQANTIEGARDELLTLISDLKASSLLTDGSDRGRFDVHDVIHDVALSIACRDGYGLFLTDDDLPRKCSDEKALNDFKWIRLQYTNMNELPDELESPQLAFFHLSNKYPSLEIPANFFKGMQRLRVLDLTRIQMPSLPSSICLLKNLHTLCLDQSILGDICIIGELKNLEILSLWRSDIKKLPRKIGQLTRLKLLDLSGCTKLKAIPPRVLASMSRLEELYMGNSFDRWEYGEHENQQNASLAELKHLKKLTALEICIHDAEIIPKDLSFEELKRYKIFIGDAWNKLDSFPESSRILKLQLGAPINFDSSIKQLLKNTEELHLEKLKGIKNILYELDREGFQELKCLYIHNAPDIQHIMDPARLHSQLRKTSFSSLRIITVECCNQLKKLFSFSTARQLLQLQEIGVTDCRNVVEVVGKEGREDLGDIVEAADQMVELGQLLSLRLQKLPKFISFCRENDAGSRHVPLFSEKVEFPYLEKLQLAWINITTIWPPSIKFTRLEFLSMSLNIQQIWHNQCLEMPSFVRNLKELTVDGCGNLRYLLTLCSEVKSFEHLESLKICDCKTMEEVIVAVEEETTQKMFPNLQALTLEDLPNLTSFCAGNYIEFPDLTELHIVRCPMLKTFISSPVIGDISASTVIAENTYSSPLFDEKVAFPQLETLIILFMGRLNKIWADQLKRDSFCNLKSLGVGGCGMLVSIFPFSMLERFQELELLLIRRCDSLEEVVEGPSASHSRALVATQPTLVKTDTKFVFSKLKELKLHELPKLKGFCHPMHTKCPNLKTLEVTECEQVQVLAAELPSFQRTNGDDQLEIQIQCPLFWVTKATFPNLEELTLNYNGTMKEMWRGQHPRDFFPELKFLELINYCKQSAFLSFLQSFILSLPKFQKLFVSEASGHEFLQSNGTGGEEKPALALAKLSEMRLSKLKELTYLWKEESHHESVFYNLTALEVLECDKLRNLMPSFISFHNLHTLELSRCHRLKNLVRYSTANSLVQLTKMSIIDCAMTAEIVACMDDEVKDGIVFTQLKSLQLRGLHRLTRFCSGNCSFDLLSLEEVIVMGCPKMQFFSMGKLVTPKLSSVKWTDDEDNGRWEGDLNTTIRELFIQKVWMH